MRNRKPIAEWRYEQSRAVRQQERTAQKASRHTTGTITAPFETHPQAS